MQGCQCDERKHSFRQHLIAATSTSGYAVRWEAGTDGYPQVTEVYKAEGIKSFVVAGVSAAIDSTKKLITAPCQRVQS